MKRITILSVLMLSIAITSCRKTLIGPAKTNSPVQNFEELWMGYSKWYGGFEARGVNWDSLYQVYRPQVNDNMSDQELYNLLCKLITPLNDPHVFIQPTSGGLKRYESNEFFRANTVQKEFSLDLVKRKYAHNLTEENEHLQYGILPGNIGYLHIGAFDRSLFYYKHAMPEIIKSLKNTKGIIVDIRNHEGGSDEASRFIAGLFTSQRRLFMTVRKRNGEKRTDFTESQEWYVEKQGDFQYTEPVILLTSRWTVSAGETFTWAMNTQRHVTQMGDTTAGAFSDVTSRELPNGWLYFIAVGDYRNASGKSDEGKGLFPQIFSRNTEEDIRNGTDKVLELAILKLQ